MGGDPAQLSIPPPSSQPARALIRQGYMPGRKEPYLRRCQIPFLFDMRVPGIASTMLLGDRCCRRRGIPSIMHCLSLYADIAGGIFRSRTRAACRRDARNCSFRCESRTLPAARHSNILKVWKYTFPRMCRPVLWSARPSRAVNSTHRAGCRRPSFRGRRPLR
jgi:hypothetical protein